MSVSEPGQSSVVEAKSGSRFRSDIEGLRALAVIAVLLFHAGFGFAGGGYVGVDVFFVISGFLITGLLLREVESTGRIGFQRFYARRIRRLLPASVVALAVTALATLLFLPENRWAGIANDIFGSAFYVVNWRFAATSVDYLASEIAASPVLHFWSLSVEEQFYVVWPLIIVAGAWFAAKTATSRRMAIGGALGVLSGVTLIYSVVFTAQSPGSAYFFTTTRMWELGIGAAVALFVPQLNKIPQSVAGAMAMAGAIAIGWAVVAYSGTTPFPSYFALLPTVGTAAVIAAGSASAETIVHRILSIKPAQWVGGLSYSLYLYHWPIIVVFDYVFEGLTPLLGLIGVVLSLLPAYLSYRFVEAPFRHSKRFVNPASRGLRYGLAMTLIGATSGAIIIGFVGADTEAIAEVPVIVAEATLSTMSESDVPVVVPEDLTPSLRRAVDDNPSVYEAGCHQNQRLDSPKICRLGNGSTTARVVIVGDSHAAQWVPALEAIAEEQGWGVASITKSGCPFGLMTMSNDGEFYESCLSWNMNVIDRLTNELRPDLVIVTSSTSNLPIDVGGADLARSEREAAYVAGLTESVEQLISSNLDVLLLADTPRPVGDIPECLARADSVSACANPRASAQRGDLHRRVAEAYSLPFVDLIDYVCTPVSCPAISGNRLIWRDNSHLTATYARHLAPLLFSAINDATS